MSGDGGGDCTILRAVALETDGCPTTAVLARRLTMDESDLVPGLALLLERGLVAEMAGAPESAARTYRVTPKGVAVLLNSVM